MAGTKKKTEENEINKESLTIEEGFVKLQSILEQMDREGVSLEDSFDLYKQGLSMVKDLNSRLKEVEEKITIVEAE